MMRNLLFVLVLAAAVSACMVAPKRDTYDAISAQVNNAAGKPAAAASDAAVAEALLPPVASLTEQLPKARQALEERFNVNFSNVPAQQFFNSLVLGTRFNILVHPEVTGSISAHLKDVTLFEALDAVRELYGYDYKVEGTKIYVRPLTMQTRMFQVNYLIGSRKGGSNLRVSSNSVAGVISNSGGGGQNGQGLQNNQNQNQNQNNQNQNNQNGQGGNNNINDSANVNTTSTNDFWADLKASIETIVGKEGGRSVVISPQSGVILIRAMPDELRNVDQYLKATQLSVDRQVILEAKILEVELNDSFQSGINWATFASFSSSHGNRVAGGLLTPGTTLTPLPFAGGQPPAITAGNGVSASTGFSITNPLASAGSLFGLAFQTSNFAALISFLESQGTVHVLSSPRIATMNNQKAVLKIGTDEFFVTGVTTTTNNTTTGNTTSPSVTLQSFFSGVVLDVTPQIDDRGNILLHVHPSVSQVSTVNKGINLGSAGTLQLPLAASDTSEMDSMVRGPNGKVVAIGGLMRQSSTADTSAVPLASSIPVLGALFKNKGQVNQKRELVVLIKPTIVDGSGSWNDDLLDTGRRIKDLDPSGQGRQ
jgi:MSHA biogenesis protein MshL